MSYQPYAIKAVLNVVVIIWNILGFRLEVWDSTELIYEYKSTTPRACSEKKQTFHILITQFTFHVIFKLHFAYITNIHRTETARLNRNVFRSFVTYYKDLHLDKTALKCYNQQ